MKLTDSRKRNSPPLDFPMTERKERDNFFQMNEITFTKRKSMVESPSKSSEISKKMFNVLLPIGKGGFGKVWKV